MGIDGEDGVATALGGGMPVSAGTASLGGVDAWLVAEIGTDDKLIALVTLDHAWPVGQPTGFWVAAVVRECVAVVAATPLGVAVLIIENHHDAGLGEPT
jgi:hypothetical protein